MRLAVGAVVGAGLVYAFVAAQMTSTNVDSAGTAPECEFAERSSEETFRSEEGSLMGLEAELIVDGLDSPTDVTSLPDSDFLLVAEKPGRVIAVEDGQVLDPPVLDIEHLILDEWNEQGLLSIELHPEFEATCELFLFFTDLDGDSNLVAAVVGGEAVPVIDENSIQTILEIPQDHQYHQSGSMAFGPEGHLWVSIGDGGLKRPDNSQDTYNLKGSILKLDHEIRPYGIPPDNPFVSSTDGRPEVWAYGVRNPWRISIDPVEGLVYVPDTGGVRYEEINVLPLSESGQNLGWPVVEGDGCLEQPDCDSAGMTTPVYKYDRDEGCAMVGGEVYRGAAIPELEGHYFFGDFCRAWIKSITHEDGVITGETEWPDLDTGSLLTTFGTDDLGELYFATLEGQLWKIVPVRG